MKELGDDKCLDPQLWHACAGGMVQMPPVNSKVYYFPQGHGEHTLTNVDFSNLTKISPMILCRVGTVKYLADPESDEVYAKLKLVPIGREHGFDDDVVLGSNTTAPDTAEKSNSFAKTLTQSDANNGGGFSVPRYCAETIFPPLDYSADPPVQTVTAKDVHGETWKFRHIYRGTPRRHLLTTGWSTFVNQKKLVAGDSIVFLRANNGELFVGIRRAKKGGIGGSDAPQGWSSAAGNYGAYPSFLREDDNKTIRSTSTPKLSSSGGRFRERGRVKPESVLEAARLAGSGKPFEVVYYPRASTPEFCVRASSVHSAMRIQWCARMRFKMAFETEDSSRISWFMGTVSSVRVNDPIRWPNSPWRLLQVTWDEPDLLQNVKNVSPWMVELVSNMPIIHMSPFSPPRKKLCLPQDFSLDSQFQIPSFSGNALGASSPFYCLTDVAAGLQGARHPQSGQPSLDLHLNNKLNMGLSPPSLRQFNTDCRIPDAITRGQNDNSENISCLLTMGNSTQKSDTTDELMTPRFLLFGHPILTEQQMSQNCPTGPVSQIREVQSSPGGKEVNSAELGIDTGHCKVFMESEDISQTLDLSVVDSYEELYKKLAHMFGIESSEVMKRVLYHDAAGAVKQIGDDPFSEFVKKAKRLTILRKSGSSSERTGTSRVREAVSSSDDRRGKMPMIS
ncbi:PREDICTED: auxin response factor 18-like isoform X1 [Ipomoea nil]|uniref:auxin response factor 18-like isoform X1 n=2 Tax=Ipomoea nil TaxID=35883 RepID=UPI000900C1E9|nr:PREDICTED: auxin response factor 18-like isoform X1 [Ipomoea nil]